MKSSYQRGKVEVRVQPQAFKQGLDGMGQFGVACSLCWLQSHRHTPKAARVSERADVVTVHTFELTKTEPHKTKLAVLI